MYETQQAFMSNESEQSKVSLQFETIESLLQKELIIPNYQRPFSWEAEQLKRLKEDILAEDVLFLGNIIIHKDKDDKQFIVDGQQRLTCLYLLANQTENLKYQSGGQHLDKHSFHLLKQAQEFFTQDVKQVVPKDWKQMKFQVTTVHDLDLAFTFFDAQNTAGLPSLSIDLIKSRHLQYMEVKGHNGPNDQRAIEMDKLWSDMESDGKLLTFFNEFLYPNRKWNKGESLETWYTNENDDRYSLKKYIVEEFASDELWERELISTTIKPDRVYYSVRAGSPYTIQRIHNCSYESDFSISLKDELLPGEYFFLYINTMFYLWKETDKDGVLSDYRLSTRLNNGEQSIQWLSRIAIIFLLDMANEKGENTIRYSGYLDFVHKSLINYRLANTRVMRKKLLSPDNDHLIKLYDSLRYPLKRNLEKFEDLELLEPNIDQTKNSIRKRVYNLANKKFTKTNI